jgi:hypothetical protein
MLIGATEFIKKYKPVILMEINEAALNQQGASPDYVFKKLVSLGYKWKVIDGAFNTPQYEILAEPK